ncbi:MAG: FAD-dependent oxidoreductase, partial [Candidatus Aminicenantes bacterium]|nr:FAD-dependent oxidoreductase [Candidatus Aminicenantes bacterium]
PVPMEGTEHEMPFDTVILAIGQAPELTFKDARSKFDLTRWNTLVVDDKTLATNIPGIFAGGDVVSGPASVIEAIAAGKKAAVSIHRYLCGELEEYRSELEKEEEERRAKEEVPEPDWAEVYKERARQKRVKVPELPRDDRVKNFEEVSLGYGEKEAQDEASRCLACGTCVECMECVKACEVGAIDHQMKDEVVELDVGAIVVATGYDLYPLPEIGEYGYGKYKDVIDGLQFERLLSASGPTLGQIRRPSDGKVPKEVVFIKCVRSRDQERGMPYCSKICCMYTAKHAMLYKHRVHDGQAYVFYMDIRAGGKGYEEFVQRATEEDEVLYLRGRVSKVFQHGDKIIVWGTDTLTGEKIEIAADLVVLSTAMLPNKATAELVKKLKVPTDPYGFLNEAHPKLRPVEFISAGLYLAGCCQAPKDIPEAVAQASGAASKVVGLFSREELFHDPAVTGVDEDLCCGCGICVEVCPYKARKLDTEKKVVEVNLALCEGCGVCGAACPTGAAQPKNFTDKQMLEMVSSILRD